MVEKLVRAVSSMLNRRDGSYLNLNSLSDNKENQGRITALHECFILARGSSMGCTAENSGKRRVN